MPVPGRPVFGGSWTYQAIGHDAVGNGHIGDLTGVRSFRQCAGKGIPQHEWRKYMILLTCPVVISWWNWKWRN